MSDHPKHVHFDDGSEPEPLVRIYPQSIYAAYLRAQFATMPLKAPRP